MKTPVELITDGRATVMLLTFSLFVSINLALSTDASTERAFAPEASKKTLMVVMVARAGAWIM